MFAKAEREKSSLREEDEGLHLRIKLSEGANNGCDFDVFAIITNNTDTERVCRLMLCARTASYSGSVGPQCGMKDLLNIALEPRDGERPPAAAGTGHAVWLGLGLWFARVQLYLRSAVGAGWGGGSPDPFCLPRQRSACPCGSCMRNTGRA